MDETLYLAYSKDPGRLRREMMALPKPSLVVLDEIQRVPALLNVIQALLDEGVRHRFILTGSSARKLKRGHANLLPGRIILEYLDPLSFWELGSRFDLEKVLRIGSLPGIYLDPAQGLDVLSTKKGWKISSYRTDAGAEVDLILDTGPSLWAIECKWGFLESTLPGA